jgi:hypothetical protein
MYVFTKRLSCRALIVVVIGGGSVNSSGDVRIPCRYVAIHTQKFTFGAVFKDCNTTPSHPGSALEELNKTSIKSRHFSVHICGEKRSARSAQKSCSQVDFRQWNVKNLKKDVKIMKKVR